MAADQRDPFDYPRDWEADLVLSDGGTVHLRPIVPSDADALLAFHGRMSERTRYLRYFGAYPQIPPRDLERFTTVDHHDRVAFVALLGDDIVAVARYERIDHGPTAEVAFVVEDRHQSRGLGPIFLEHLAAAAREVGIERFVAEVLAENSAMLGVFRAAGYQVTREMEEGVFHLEFAIDPTEESVAVARSREQAAEARSVHNLLHPRSVALIGASTDPDKIGYAVLGNLLRADFAGPVFPVNAEHRSVRGVRAYASVLDIPDPVDLAVVAVPAEHMDEVMDACLAKGVKALVVIASGFSDAGPAGEGAERRLVTEARAHGMRVVGPNALGVVNTDPAVRLNATLAPKVPGRGRSGFFSQSGALGTAILADAAARGLGLSTFVSAGNRADVSGNDLLQYWETDPATDVVLLYLESFGNPRKFARLARRLGRVKPIVAVKSGRNAVLPALAATSVAVDDASVQALFEQAGVIRVESLAQLFDTGLLLAHQPLPRGGRVAVVGNSSAIGVLAADAALGQGLELAGQPVDVGASAGPDVLAAAVREHLRGDEVDALVVVFVPPLSIPGAEYARALRDAAAEEGGTKPIVSTFLATEGIPAELAVRGKDGSPARGSIPSYPSPERAVLALARATRYATWRSAPQGELVRPEGVDVETARTLVESRLSEVDDGLVELTDAEAVRLLSCYGIEIAPHRAVASADEAVAVAEELGYPVAVKATGERWWRRSDLEGVRLDLATAEAVRAAFADLTELTEVADIYVQRMARKGIGCSIGLRDDPSFGTLVSFGLSGVVSDLLGDRAYRALPLTDVDAAALVRAPKAAPLLTGYRGTEPADLDALADLVLRVAALAEDVPEVRWLLLEPILAAQAGAQAVGARVKVGPPPSRQDSGPRRLRSLTFLRK
ncbi:bifunctional acetate--CoA ligase family protein/GNAT family N-acetyltransferase [Actinophytocola algeriensis]|uniref:Acyl-CoA synthetase (NDP forming)/RimJ/RimL family protein N-acetyltransferase n=1 Tax=Actinophytocola algeriensis TaxID=1768010 RepID=A0A7W7VCA2_9PSEU|nr:bifunctional GNAT family N-acetyltransferase/acetate--CoA ligase family protein [Actinophytocola algeriensis]MBB4904889.1 acyl-CoA synthetase (NDP forming)/RimJ/RimL family protein N-acetyltransferase [Actinophytocola algeriensis]MBE1476252.1 acyl-CoA synthetase (NDP forming)/RimJ/RimL family protein N-acetyltransferase [Actinophytocola algeriensis]